MTMTREINSRNPYNRFLIALVGVAFVGFTFVGVHMLATTAERSGAQKVVTTTEHIPVFLDPFAAVELEAEAAYVLDARTGAVLYEENAEQQLPLASLTKLMTTLVASRELPDEGTISISERAIREEGDSGFSVNERLSIRDLIDYTLVTSSNDGAYALASVAAHDRPEEFIDKMNRFARSLGLVQTFFTNETGLDSSLYTGGAYGSAKDMTHLLVHIIKNEPELLEQTRNDEITVFSEDGKEYVGENTNKAIGELPGLIASKTGYTDLAGGNLVVAFDAGLNRPIVIAVLGSTIEGRFEDTTALARASLEYIQTTE